MENETNNLSPALAAMTATLIAPQQYASFVAIARQTVDAQCEVRSHLIFEPER